MPPRTRRDETELCQNIHLQDIEHRNKTSCTEMIVRDEDARRLKVDLLLIRNERNDLKELMRQKDDQITCLRRQHEETLTTVASTTEAYKKQQKQLRVQLREGTHLKAELESLNGLSQESAQVLTEKLALAREISSMKLEMEHLRSQLVHGQNMIAEKLALERQLNSAEVELAAEKKARQQVSKAEIDSKVSQEALTQKMKMIEAELSAEKKEKGHLQAAVASAKTPTSGTDDESNQERLQNMVQQLGRELMLERKEREQEREMFTVTLSGAEEAQNALESKLSATKRTLRGVQMELKACKAEMMASSRGPSASTSNTAKARASKSNAKGASSLEAGLAGFNEQVSDPPEEGDLIARKAAKKRGADHSLMGEKSLFSVTPFLSRTKAFDIDIVMEENEDEDRDDQFRKEASGGSGESDVHTPINSQAAAEKAHVARSEKPAQVSAFGVTGDGGVKTTKPRGRPKKVLTEASSNLPTTTSTTIGKAYGLDGKPGAMVPEDSAFESLETGTRKASVTKTAQDTKAGMDTKRKRRKLVGDTSKTIFDSEDMEALDLKPKRPPKVQLGGNRTLGKSMMRMPRENFGKAAFSPLKKDRRGVHASFIA